MSEMLSQVDQNDEVIGITTKIDSHTSGVIHRVVAIIVMRGKSILVNQRQDNDLFDHSVGGHVRDGESYENAAIRELREEIGLIVTKKDLTMLDHFFLDETPRSKNLRHWFTLYSVSVRDDFTPEPDLQEIKALQFRSMQDIAKGMAQNPSAFDQGFITTFTRLQSQR